MERMERIYTTGRNEKKFSVKKLNRRIALKSDLLQQFYGTGMVSKAKYYTPLQMCCIMETPG